MTPEEKHKFMWRSFDRPLQYVCKKLKPKRALEWGPGLSTSIIAANSPDVRIYTIEHNPKYFKKVQQLWDGYPVVDAQFREISLKGGKSTGYITAPLFEELQSRKILSKGDAEEIISLQPCYDLVFVDGRSRFDCLNVAHLLVKDLGVVFLHDTHRVNYHAAADLFPYKIQLNDRRTWIMSKSPLDWFAEGYSETNEKNTVLSHEETLNRLQDSFTSEGGSYYTRFGDADLFFIDNPEFARNKRHDPNPFMSEELMRSFMIDDPRYDIGCVAGGKVFNCDGELKSIADRFHNGKTYYSAIALHHHYIHDADRFESFTRSCFHGKKKVLFVGGKSVANNPLVRKVFNVSTVLAASDRNSYVLLDKMMPSIEKHVKTHDVIAVALGQATRCLAARLWLKGYHNIKFFDTGSSVDALAERHLRSWIRKHPKKVEEYKKRFK